MSERPRRIVIATQNLGKLREIREILSDWPVEWETLRGYPGCPEALESAPDYLNNAREKASLAAEYCAEWALADDSGLEVEALDGAPGVRSARYAGEKASDAENFQKLIEELASRSATNRKAAFRCTLVLRHPDGRELIGEGELRGHIAELPRGDGGFGYDPIFIPEGFDRSLAELSPQEKNSLSHRRQALRSLTEALFKAFPDLGLRDR